jgi:hypothetical protein
MTLNTNKKPSTQESVESADSVKSAREGRSMAPVPTRIGQNTVDIDVTALRHLVSKVKSELKPDGRSN